MRLAGGPSAWDSETVRSDRSWVHEFDSAQVQELVAATRSALASGKGVGNLTRDDFMLPTLSERLLGVLDDVVDGHGFALLRGMPVGELTRQEACVLYWGIGEHLGIPIRQNEAGDLLVSVTDEGKSFSDPTVRGYQTRDRLDFHSDSSDLVGLLCLRPAWRGGASMIVSGVAIHDEIARRRPDLAEVLHRPFWFDRRKADQSSSFFACPVFGWSKGGQLAVYYGRAHIESAQRGRGIPVLTPQQVEALDLFDELSCDPRFAVSMDFQPGDIQVLNNHLILHSRTAYEDGPDPAERRELLRLWLTLRRPLALPPEFEEAGIVARGEAFR